MTERVLYLPDAPATDKQKRMINWLMKEVRAGYVGPFTDEITRQEASDLIKQLNSEKESLKGTIQSEVSVISYEKIWAEAIEAANAAGDDWMANATPKFRVVQRANPLDDNSPIVKDYGTMLDVCGFSGIEIGDKRTKFAKWLVTKQASTYSVRLPHKYTRRQELGLAEDCARAALEVFRKHGVDKGLRFYSRID